MSAWNQILSTLTRLLMQQPPPRPWDESGAPGSVPGLPGRRAPDPGLPAMLANPPLPPAPPMSLYQQLFANMGNAQQGPAAQNPLGPTGGPQNLLPQQYGWLGKTRPLGPGESVTLPNGQRASEEDYTIPFGENDWRVVPGLWLVNGVPTKVSEDQAMQLARQSGLQFPTFPDQKTADEQYVNPREAKWESGAPTTMQPPIWRYRK